DLVAEKASLGYLPSIGIWGAAIALITFAHYVLKLNPVTAFWFAYILTRPLGASIGDGMSQNDPKYGGLGLGTTGTSYIFLGCILVLVLYLAKSKRDQTPPEVIVAEEAAAAQHPHELHLPHPHLPHREHAQHAPGRSRPVGQEG